MELPMKTLGILLGVRRFKSKGVPFQASGLSFHIDVEGSDEVWIQPKSADLG